MSHQSAIEHPNLQALENGGLLKGPVENINMRKLDIVDVHLIKGVRGKLKIQFDSYIMQERVLREVREIYSSEKRPQGMRRKN